VEKFYLMDNLPRTLLLGYPFCERTGVVLDARAGTLFIADYKETIPLLRTTPDKKSELVFTTFGVSNFQTPIQLQQSLTSPMPFIDSSHKYATYVRGDISMVQPRAEIMNVFGVTAPRQRMSSVDEKIIDLQKQEYKDELMEKEYEQQLNSLIKEYEDVFDTECTTPAKIPPVHVDIKPEYQGKRFFRPEPLRSHKDQHTIDQNYRKLISQGKAKLNPTSIHNLGQVIVPRYDKEGKEVEGRARVCIDARPINIELLCHTNIPFQALKRLFMTYQTKKNTFLKLIYQILFNNLVYQKSFQNC
jgi:hypothetical protein